MGKKKLAKELEKENLGLEVDAGLDTECQKDVVDYFVQEKKKKSSKQLDSGEGKYSARENEHQKEDESRKAVDDSLKEDRRKNRKKKLESKEDEVEDKKRRKKADRVSGDGVVSESLNADLADKNPDINALDNTDAESFKEKQEEKHEKPKKHKNVERTDATASQGAKFGDSQTIELDESNNDARKKKKKKTTQGEQKSTVDDKVREDAMLLDGALWENSSKKKERKREKRKESKVQKIIDTGEEGDHVKATSVSKKGEEEEEDTRKKKKKKETTQGEQNSTVDDKVIEDAMLLEDALLENSSKKKQRKREKKKESKVQKNIDMGKEGDHGKATNMSKKVKVRNNKVAKSQQSVEDLQHSGLQSTKKKSKKVSFADNVEVFTSNDSSSELSANDEKKLVRGKRFSEEEDELVRKSVYDFIEAKDLGENGLEMVLHCKNYPEIKKTCWKEIAAALPWRPLESVYHRAHILFERGEERSWTEEEYNLIKKFYEEHGADWRKLGDALGKHRFHVKDAWRRINVANLKKGQWSQEEYQALFDLVNIDIHMKAFDEKKSKHGMLRDNIAWTAISDKMATRRVTACCDKWYRQLTSPMVVEGKWADADDYRLLNALLNLDACSMEDVDWDNLIEGRSGDICRKRWSQMVRHIGDYGSKSFAEQVELLSRRYSPDVLEAREAFDNRPVVS